MGIQCIHCGSRHSIYKVMQSLHNHMDCSPLNCTVFLLLVLYLHRMKVAQVCLAMLQAHQEGKAEFLFLCIRKLVSWLRKQGSLAMATNLHKLVLPLENSFGLGSLFLLSPHASESNCMVAWWASPVK